MAAVLTILLCLPISAFAATEVEIEIPVTVQLTGDIPPTFIRTKCVIEPLDANNPMPANGNELSFDGSGQSSFGPMTYDEVGEYKYYIYQRPNYTAGFTYDRSRYLVTVVVLNGDTLDDREAVVLISKDGQAEKPGEVVCENNYRTPESETEDQPDNPVKTGDDFNPILWISIGVSALLLIIILSIVMKRRKKEDTDDDQESQQS